MSTLISQSNPYLQNPKERDQMITRSVITSCGVEGIKVTEAELLAMSDFIKHRRPKKLDQFKAK